MNWRIRDVFVSQSCSRANVWSWAVKEGSLDFLMALLREVTKSSLESETRILSRSCETSSEKLVATVGIPAALYSYSFTGFTAEVSSFFWKGIIAAVKK